MSVKNRCRSEFQAWLFYSAPSHFISIKKCRVFQPNQPLDRPPIPGGIAHLELRLQHGRPPLFLRRPPKRLRLSLRSPQSLLPCCHPEPPHQPLPHPHLPYASYRPAAGASVPVGRSPGDNHGQMWPVLYAG